MLRAQYVLLGLLLGTPLWAQAPGPSYSDPAAPPFIVRMQRIRPGDKVCAIVRADGFFHVEVERTGEAEISEGSLDKTELADLTAKLNYSDLVALRQNQIPPVLTAEEVFLVSILRPQAPQDLTFNGRESWRPFDSFISPLFHWMDILQRHSHVSLDEFHARHNCLPPKNVELKSRPSAPGTAEASAGATAPSIDNQSAAASASTPAASGPLFLMYWRVVHITSTNVQSTCILVYPAGGYHMEKITQPLQEKPRFGAFEDSLDKADLQHLGALLEEPELKSSTHQNESVGQFFTELELTTLEVPRDRHVQRLSFVNHFGIPGGRANPDPAEHIVAPLRKWLKANVESRKTPALHNAFPTHCAPQPQTATP